MSFSEVWCTDIPNNRCSENSHDSNENFRNILAIALNFTKK